MCVQLWFYRRVSIKYDYLRLGTDLQRHHPNGVVLNASFDNQILLIFSKGIHLLQDEQLGQQDSERRPAPYARCREVLQQCGRTLLKPQQGRLKTDLVSMVSGGTILKYFVHHSWRTSKINKR